ncbi:MAG: hypothetical protein ABEJ42_01510 [Halobacteriaceae archaeon]
MRLLVVPGHTETARIDGISAAGADPDAVVQTPGERYLVAVEPAVADEMLNLLRG